MSMSKAFSLRPLRLADQAFLWEMLYQSLYVPAGQEPFARSILRQPEIAVYVKDWGRADDSGFVAVSEQGQRVGAVWLRLLQGAEKGFGYVDDRTPELGMAVLPAYRGQGIGTSLLARLIEAATDSYEQISLSVSAANPARRLYHRLGFVEIEQSGDSLTMKRRLKIV